MLNRSNLRRIEVCGGILLVCVVLAADLFAVCGCMLELKVEIDPVAYQAMALLPRAPVVSPPAVVGRVLTD